MNVEMNTKVVVRPVRNVDTEALGRVHATCWHETYDHLVSKAALESLSPRRMAELWSHWSSLGPEYRQYVAVADGEIVGFSGSGPSRDDDTPRERELYFLYLLSAWHGTGIGQQLFDIAVEDDAVSLWVAEDNPRAHRFYERNGFKADGSRKVEPFLGETVTEVRLVR
ncbi:MAG TPA: GNAT family N-acetyltransferase [Microbacteriaceae bacterium]|jgi:ribosomal protein S18 acetylase RimI-like enzyme|nr:GNAT family N-acetyltransferase [Microbacteriaceae bacterium]HQX36643.1 GNAT family N-acetyltransferase [Microbacteriaceae bacterium]HQZ47691.1 GNAT family N-acetyltransferase [Microbacteriaceae bacterium]HRA09661.1 GNAT family N-acetyltransferase [Microbacteriaceae bacterium]